MAKTAKPSNLAMAIMAKPTTKSTAKAKSTAKKKVTRAVPKGNPFADLKKAIGGGIGPTGTPMKGKKGC